ncbi:Amine sulfotransferase [Holothuria leucospilota]|uniref:Amine sulfotransferase n=1 Tax=Holothuria leucospilota TaxID=206669 RepID=A0A9Q0YJI1_HOLLE|nr:Amine sulfotransferase [Holothuria leucospilota]
MDRDKILSFEQLVLFDKNGFPLPANTSEDFMKELHDMKVREDDIFVVTYPKSGTHWMQEIVHLILVEGHGEMLDSRHRQVVIEVADARSISPEAVAANGPILRLMKSAPSPRVLTTHVPSSFLPKQQRETPRKLIYVYRHPKDVIVSYYHFMLKILEICTGEKVVHSKQQFANFFDLFISGKFQYGSWFDHVTGYYEYRDNVNFLAISFEAMKKDLRAAVQEIASFIGQHLDDASVGRVVEGASLNSMKKSFRKDQDQNKALGKNVLNTELFVNKGQMRQWKDYFTAEQNQRVDHLFCKKMQNCHWTEPYAPDSEEESSTT